MQHIIKILLVCTISWNLFACGTILYPERKGQVDGRLDVGVVILNSVGLLLFLLPGVIAFAVDFSNGTIYLPGGQASSLSDEELDVLSRNDINGLDVRVLLQRHGWAAGGNAVPVGAEAIDVIRINSMSAEALYPDFSQPNTLRIIQLASGA
ncbi:MAG: hypothetical protein WBN40_08120 [Pseudomonadales bacterium]